MEMIVNGIKSQLKKILVMRNIMDLIKKLRNLLSFMIRKLKSADESITKEEKGMIFKITRFYDDGETTLGKLHLDAEYLPQFREYGVFDFFTVEPPWKDNKRDISCIPAGTYIVKPFDSPKHGKCLLFENVPDRSFIEMHAGNSRLDTDGCVCPGDSIIERFYDKKHNEHNPGVFHSAKTMRIILSVIKEPTPIEIVDDIKMRKISELREYIKSLTV